MPQYTKKREKKTRDKAGAPGWMVTYGDMMSLLLCFFVLLVSMSSIHEAKFRQALGSLLGALGVMRMDSAVIEHEELPVPERYQREFEKVREQFDEFREELVELELDGAVDVTETDEGMLVRMSNPILFDTGKADIKQEGYGVLRRLLDIFLGLDAEIRIEGHTDNVPINNRRYPSNWELSAARSIEVLKFFSRGGFPGDKLTAIGRGEFHPLVENDSPDHRSQNRRVDIYVDYKRELERKVARQLIHAVNERNGEDESFRNGSKEESDG
jgi:chemotaxis protein MotB